MRTIMCLPVYLPIFINLRHEETGNDPVRDKNLCITHMFFKVKKMESAIQVRQIIYGNALMNIILAKFLQLKTDAHLGLFIMRPA